jgi:hypothetical protein
MFSSHGVRRFRFHYLFDAPLRLRRYHPDFDLGLTEFLRPKYDESN